MENFIYPGILSSISLLVYYFTLLQAGLARVKYNIKAPPLMTVLKNMLEK